jgi:hypothetical protein
MLYEFFKSKTLQQDLVTSQGCVRVHARVRVCVCVCESQSLSTKLKM